MFTVTQYNQYRDALRGQPLPLAFVDLDAFDANIHYVASRVKDSGKTVRIGSKSVRCAALLQRIFDVGGASFQGLLTYTAEETAWLAEKGYNDFILAYPTVQEHDLTLLAELTRRGKEVVVMVDNLPHLEKLSRIGSRYDMRLKACMEVDMSYRPLPNLHLGVRRSPIRTPDEALDLVRRSRHLPGVEITALMGYEGHIAGTNDAIPGQAVKNWFMRLLKNDSVRELTRRRCAVVKALREEGLRLEIVNGGGSGSLASTLQDPSVTEVTVGSGFYAPGLFHHFQQVHYQPAAFFALQIVRFPAKGMLTCQGGGYIASGPVGKDKMPLPALPPGLQFLPLEGAGEVQTPLRIPRNCPELSLGDPVIFQHAKAGELGERFNDFLLLQNGRVVGKVPTYRGEGRCFL